MSHLDTLKLNWIDHYFNSLQDTIKFTIESSTKGFNFLDTTVKIDSQNKLMTRGSLAKQKMHAVSTEMKRATGYNYS